MLSTLPTELIHLIIDHVPYDSITLSRCCLVSKTFHSRSHPKLYGTFVIGISHGLAWTDGDMNDDTSRIRRSTMARMRSMDQNPLLISLLKFVRTLELPREEEEEDSLPITDIPPELFVPALISFYQKSAYPPKLQLFDSSLQPKLLVQFDHLTSLKIGVTFLNDTTWKLLDVVNLPSLLHLRLDFPELNFADAPPLNFSPPSLVSGEVTGDRITREHNLSELFVNSLQSLRRLRLPLRAVSKTGLARYKNLTELVITDFGAEFTSLLTVKLFLLCLRRMDVLETLSIYGESSETYNGLFESGSLAEALPPTRRTLNLPQAGIRQIVLLFCDAGANGVTTLGYPVNLVESNVEYRAIHEFCKMKGLRSEQCSVELPDWNPIGI